MHPAGYWSSPLVRRFVAELLRHTMDIADEAAYQRELQAFLDELNPWVDPGDCPALRAAFTMFAQLEMDDLTETVSVAFTPEGLAFFRAWLRRQGIDPTVNMS
jgi:hypothetical protein